MALRMNPFAVNYNAIRNILIGRLKRISVFFKYRINFTVQNLLFPHSWQLKPYRDGLSKSEYRKKINSQTFRRIGIFKEIVNFVKSTKRFALEKYGI